jgi:hypothetical protein
VLTISHTRPSTNTGASSYGKGKHGTTAVTMPERSYLRRAIKDTIEPFTEDMTAVILGAEERGLNVANSKRKLILDYIKATTLPLITTGGGYNSTIALVKRGVTSLDSVADSELPALFLGKTIEKRENITREPV